MEADLHTMSRHHRLRIVAALVLLLMVGCGRQFTRENAVAALQHAGADRVTATCMADTLASLNELAAADVEVASTDESRAALVRARDRCSAYTTPESETQASVAGITLERSTAPSAGDPPPPSAVIGSPGGGVESANAEAIQRLVALGRDETTAQCVVDHLSLLSAQYVFDDPTFGLAATPEEASAFALCS